MIFLSGRKFVMLVALSAIPCTSLAQMAGRPRVYDPSTVATIQGSILKVTQIENKRGSVGEHFTLTSSDGTYEVHLGPSAFIRQNGFTFSAGDQVEVVGSKIASSGGSTLIAREIRKDGKVLALRDQQGLPLWANRSR